MAGKMRKLASLAMAFILVCLLAEGLRQFYVVTPPVVLASPDTERQSPDAVLSSSGLTGGVTDIDDDPDVPDGNWMVATGNNTHTSVRTSFPTPTGNPTVGADLQEFKIWVRQYDENQAGTPDVRIDLWENGVLVRAGTRDYRRLTET